jgi:hypothetical protein
VIPVAAVSTVTFEIWTSADADLAMPAALPFPNDVAPPLPPAGWIHTETITDSRLVVVGEDGRLVTLDPDESPLCQRVVPCDWPPAEDAQRLAPVLEQLRAEAVWLDEED